MLDITTARTYLEAFNTQINTSYELSMCAVEYTASYFIFVYYDKKPVQSIRLSYEELRNMDFETFEELVYNMYREVRDKNDLEQL